MVAKRVGSGGGAAAAAVVTVSRCRTHWWWWLLIAMVVEKEKRAASPFPQSARLQTTNRPRLVSIFSRLFVLPVPLRLYLSLRLFSSSFASSCPSLSYPPPLPTPFLPFFLLSFFLISYILLFSLHSFLPPPYALLPLPLPSSLCDHPLPRMSYSSRKVESTFVILSLVDSYR